MVLVREGGFIMVGIFSYHDDGGMWTSKHTSNPLHNSSEYQQSIFSNWDELR